MRARHLRQTEHVTRNIDCPRTDGKKYGQTWAGNRVLRVLRQVTAGIINIINTCAFIFQENNFLKDQQVGKLYTLPSSCRSYDPTTTVKKLNNITSEASASVNWFHRISESILGRDILDQNEAIYGNIPPSDHPDLYSSGLQRG